jgi:hypothetical protein
MRFEGCGVFREAWVGNLGAFREADGSVEMPAILGKFPEQAGIVVQDQASRDATPLGKVAGNLEIRELFHDLPGDPGMEKGSTSAGLQGDIDSVFRLHPEDLLEEIDLQGERPSIGPGADVDDEGRKIETALDGGTQLEEVLVGWDGGGGRRSLAGGDVADKGKPGFLEVFVEEEPLLRCGWGRGLEAIES